MIINQLKTLLSEKMTGIIILILAIIGRVAQVLYFFNIRSDRSFQLLATDNLLHGNGLSTSQVFASDLSREVFEPLIKWPPGYSLLVSPFYELFNHDYIKAALSVDILFAISFVFVVRGIAIQLQLATQLVNLLTFISGFFIYDFFFISSTDAIAITFFLTGIYCCVYLIRKKKYEIIPVAGMAISLLAAAFLKYLFIPVVFIVPFYFVVKGLRSGVHWMKKPGYIVFLFLAICIVGLFMYQSPQVDATYTGEGTKGFFPGNLRESYPFIPASFIKPASVFDITGFWLKGIFLFIHILLLGAWVLVILWLRQLRAGLHISVQFTQIVFLISIFLYLVLFFLSVTTGKHEEMPGFFWTYVQERRYYGLPNVLIHILTCALFQYSISRRKKILHYILIGLMIILVPELIRGVVHSGSRLFKYQKETYSWQYDRGFQREAQRIYEEVELKSGSGMRVITSPDYYFSNRIALSSHASVLYDASKIMQPQLLQSEKPAVVMLVLKKTDMLHFQSYVERSQLLGSYKDLLFYIEYVNPQ